ncbi:MAG: AraC family transcriptional regulator, partial [Microbacterium sp.]
MATVDPDALTQVLGSVDLRVGVARRLRLEAGALLPLAPGAAYLVYVAEGGVHGHPPLSTGCSLDVDRASHLVAVDL